jgi:hypothetical protein
MDPHTIKHRLIFGISDCCIEQQRIETGGPIWLETGTGYYSFIRNERPEEVKAHDSLLPGTCGYFMSVAGFEIPPAGTIQ